jgi:hypothetical protein
MFLMASVFTSAIRVRTLIWRGFATSSRFTTWGLKAVATCTARCAASSSSTLPSSTNESPMARTVTFEFPIISRMVSAAASLTTSMRVNWVGEPSLLTIVKLVTPAFLPMTLSSLSERGTTSAHRGSAMATFAIFSPGIVTASPTPT